MTFFHISVVISILTLILANAFVRRPKSVPIGVFTALIFVFGGMISMVCVLPAFFQGLLTVLSFPTSFIPKYGKNIFNQIKRAFRC